MVVSQMQVWCFYVFDLLNIIFIHSLVLKHHPMGKASRGPATATETSEGNVW
jgi:hypothetical protein